MQRGSEVAQGMRDACVKQRQSVLLLFSWVTNKSLPTYMWTHLSPVASVATGFVSLLSSRDCFDSSCETGLSVVIPCRAPRLSADKLVGG